MLLVRRDVLVEILCMMEGGPTVWVLLGDRHHEVVVRKRTCANVVRTAASGRVTGLVRCRKMLEASLLSFCFPLNFICIGFLMAIPRW